MIRKELGNQTWRKQRSVITLLALAVLILPPFITNGLPEPSKTVEITDLVVIKAGALTAPPPWAVMQRLLIRTMEEAAPVYLRRFTRAGGTVYGQGMVDDVYEMFFNWPLFYAMGGDEKLMHWALQEWNAITRQFTYQDPQIHKEFFAIITATGFTSAKAVWPSMILALRTQRFLRT